MRGELAVEPTDADLEDRLAVVLGPHDAHDLEAAELAGEAVALDHDVEALGLEHGDHLGGIGRAEAGGRPVGLDRDAASRPDGRPHRDRRPELAGLAGDGAGRRRRR